MTIQQRCVEAYRRHKHLKLAGDDLGIPWQSVYVHLRKAGEPVTGDKIKYGSDKDRLAAFAEAKFLELVPYAEPMNRTKYQAKYDFDVRGHKVEVKSSRAKQSNKNCKLKRYAFSLKKQEHIADFFVCFFMDGCFAGDALLIPGEIARHYQTISISESGGKWLDYLIKRGDIEPFFRSLPPYCKGEAV